MKKVLWVIFACFLFLGATWTYSPKKYDWSSGKESYKLQAVFGTSATLSSGRFGIVGKDHNDNWFNSPLTAYYRVTAVDSIVLTRVTVYAYGVISSQRFIVDTLAIDIGTKTDSINYTTLNFNNRKFPEYQVDITSDSCTVIMELF